MLRRGFAIAIIHIFCVSTFAMAGDESAKVKSACDQLVHAHVLTGAAVLSIQSGKSRSVLCGDVSKLTDLFEIGSITKSFTAIALQELVDEKKIDLDAPVSVVLPELKGSFVGQTTPRLLALHSAQLVRNYVDSKGALSQNFSEGELLDFLKSYQPDAKAFPPGKRSYSNLGFNLLGLLISRVSHSSFSEVIERRIFSPLQMDQSVFLSSPTPPPGLLPGRDVLLAPLPYNEVSDLMGAASGIASSPHDMNLYLQASLLPNIRTSLGLAMSETQKQGLGWDSLPGKQPIWKDGDMIAGYSSLILLNPASDLGAVVLGDELSSAHLAKLAGLAIGKNPKVLEPEPSSNVLSTITGTYDSTEKGFEIEVFRDPLGPLGIQIDVPSEGDFRARLFSVPETSLRFDVDDGVDNSDVLEFSKDPSSHLETLVYTSSADGVKTKFTRK